MNPLAKMSNPTAVAVNGSDMHLKPRIPALKTTSFVAGYQRRTNNPLIRVLPAPMPSSSTVRIYIEQVGDRDW